MSKRTYNDVSGAKYGRLTVVKCIGKINKYYHWECLCECGNVVSVSINNLNSGHTKSCGCLNIDALISRATHGHSKNGKISSEYIIWSQMRTRCTKEDNHSYSNYGGRGIKVCDRWLYSFGNFFEDMGTRPKGLTLDRKDNDGDYTPENCRWATSKEQADNRRRSRWYELNGMKMVMNDWAKKIGIDGRTLSAYLKRHSFEEAYNHYTKNVGTNFIPYAFGYII